MSEIWRTARKKPVIVQFREVNGEVETITTLEGEMKAHKDKHFVVSGIDGELYPIEKSIFYRTYEVL